MDRVPDITAGRRKPVPAFALGLLAALVCLHQGCNYHLGYKFSRHPESKTGSEVVEREESFRLRFLPSAVPSILAIKVSRDEVAMVEDRYRTTARKREVYLPYSPLVDIFEIVFMAFPIPVVLVTVSYFSDRGGEEPCIEQVRDELDKEPTTDEKRKQARFHALGHFLPFINSRLYHESSLSVQSYSIENSRRPARLKADYRTRLRDRDLGIVTYSERTVRRKERRVVEVAGAEVLVEAGLGTPLRARTDARGIATIDLSDYSPESGHPRRFTPGERRSVAAYLALHRDIGATMDLSIPAAIEPPAVDVPTAGAVAIEPEESHGAHPTPAHAAVPVSRDLRVLIVPAGFVEIISERAEGPSPFPSYDSFVAVHSDRLSLRFLVDAEKHPYHGAFHGRYEVDLDLSALPAGAEAELVVRLEKDRPGSWSLRETGAGRIAGSGEVRRVSSN